MKKLSLLLAAFFLGAASMFAQNSAREMADRMVAKYDFDQTQAAEALKIEERRAKNLSEIEQYRTSNPALFSKKTISAHMGARSSYRMILKTQAQIAQFDAMLNELRTAKSAKQKELKSRKAAKAEVAAAEAEIEAKF